MVLQASEKQSAVDRGYPVNMCQPTSSVVVEDPIDKWGEAKYKGVGVSRCETEES